MRQPQPKLPGGTLLVKEGYIDMARSCVDAICWVDSVLEGR